MNDFSNLNHLSAEVKMLIIKGQTLIDDAKNKMANRATYPFDLTSIRQLKSDCRKVEKCIQQIADGKTSDKYIKELENSIIRLETILKGLVSFFTRG